MLDPSLSLVDTMLVVAILCSTITQAISHQSSILIAYERLHSHHVISRNDVHFKPFYLNVITV